MSETVTSTYRLWVNDERTVLVRMWTDSTGCAVEVATRESASDTWGPPVCLSEEDA